MTIGLTLDDYKTSAHWMDGPHGRIAWWTKGSGRPVLLIHGFPTCSLDWSRIWPGLAAAGFNPIALDMLGFGLSDKPGGHAYSIIEQADLQVQLLRQLDITALDIIVHDYGVSVGQELLARQDAGQLPFQINRMVFLNGGLFPEQHRPRPVQRLLNSPLGGLVTRFLNRRSFGRSFAAVFGPETQPETDELDLFWTLLAHNDGHRLGHRLIKYIDERKRHRDRWVRALGTQKAKIFMINGTRDPVSGAHLADEFARHCPHAPLRRLAVGHYPQWEAADEVRNQCLAWLNDP